MAHGTFKRLQTCQTNTCSLSPCLFLPLAPNCKYIHLKISARNITQKRTKIFHNMQSKQSEESKSDKETEREREREYYLPMHNLQIIITVPRASLS